MLPGNWWAGQTTASVGAKGSMQLLHRHATQVHVHGRYEFHCLLFVLTIPVPSRGLMVQPFYDA